MVPAVTRHCRSRLLHQADTPPWQAFEAVMVVGCGAALKGYVSGHFWRQDRSAVSLKRVEAE